MKILTIPKGKSGKFRTIYCPDKDEKKRSASWIKLTQAKLLTQPNVNVLHGFMPGRSPVTNALAHVGWQFSLSFDLKDFFDSVRPSHVANMIGDNDTLGRFVNDCFYDGAARQGLPSSPAIANLAACPMDNAICKLINRSRLGQNFTYTRYADDLTFSFNYDSVGRMLLEKMPEIVAAHGFTINKTKTHLQCAKAGRRIITGVAVDDSGVHPTREVKRRIRAMRHQLSNSIQKRGYKALVTKLLDSHRRGGTTNIKSLLINGYLGLKEWSRLKVPEDFKEYGKAAQVRTPVAPRHNSPTPTALKMPSLGLARAIRKFIFD